MRRAFQEVCCRAFVRNTNFRRSRSTASLPTLYVPMPYARIDSALGWPNWLLATSPRRTKPSSPNLETPCGLCDSGAT